jgi:hypothetical protein
MALGLRLFGLHVWAGRLPLVVAAVAGLGATYLLVRRLAGLRAAALSVLVLATMPLYFLQARTLLGDGVTLAALAVAGSGLTLAVFDRGSLRLRLGFLALGVLGLVAGLLSRGLLLGVAVPLLGPALAWLVLRVSGGLPRERARDTCGAALLGAGLLAAALGARLFARALDAPERYFMWLGFGISRPAAAPTFDAVIGQLGHGLFPWSAFLPVALARLTGRSGGARHDGLRLSCLVTATLGLFAWGGVAADAGLMPFGPVAALAVLMALALAELDRGAPASRAAGMTGVALLVLLLADFLNEPDKAFVPFVVEGAHFPESFKHAGTGYFVAGSALAALCFFAALLERDDDGGEPFVARDYVAWLETLRDLWRGNLLFGACVLEAGLLGFVGFDLLGERVPLFARFAASSQATREAARKAWLIVPLLVALPLLTLALRDAVRWLAGARSRSRLGGWLPPRSVLAAFGGVACGAGLSLGYYPALAAQLSPDESFDTFRRLARPREELAVIGSGALGASYTAGRDVSTLEDPDEASGFLLTHGVRRWLVLRSDALPGLNSRYRLQFHAGNLPILDARSSENLLASNELRPGEKNENPLGRYVLDRAPQPLHPLAANLAGVLDVLGWDVTDLDGAPVRSITTGRRYEFVIYLHVTSRITGAWETFIHIDGFQRRYNGDHPTLDGHYPFALWNVGDFIADRHEIRLEPYFPHGTYEVFFGYYMGDRRMPVRRGQADDSRVAGGELVVE